MSSPTSVPRRGRRDRLVVGKSPIHGQGLFAAKAFERAALMGRLEGSRTTRNGPHVLWFPDTRGKIVGLRGRNALRFINHSANPNARFHGSDLYSIRYIAAGEEVTVDYGEEWREHTD